MSRHLHPLLDRQLDGTSVEVGDVTLDVHVDGPADGDVVLLVSGLGQQRLAWPPELRDALHDAGHRSVTVDNRDVGRSTVFPGTVMDLPRGDDGWPLPAYGLATMAADLVGVLDHLGVDRAHVVGVSMGGMIAQHLAFGHPERVRTLTSVMSTTGARGVGTPHRSVRWVLTTLSPTDPEAYADHAVRLAGAIGSPGLVDEARVRALASAAWQRGLHPQGTARQFLAIRADGDRTDRLATVDAPTLVVHGTEDLLIAVSGGHATAAAVPGAELVLVEGMGHDLPVPLLPQVLDPLLAHLASQR